MVRAAAIGIDVRRAFNMTPREIALQAAGFVERQKEDQRAALFVAWVTAKLQRSAEIPPFETCFPQAAPMSPATRSKMNRARMDALKAQWNAQYKRRSANG